MSTHEPPPSASGRQWATEIEAADHARVSNNTIRRWRERGLITGYKVGRTVRYDLVEVDELIGSGAGQ